MSLVIRVRTQLGTWRLQKVDPADSLGNLRSRVEREHQTDLQGRPFTKDAGGGHALPDHATVKQAGLVNGDMIYAMVDETKTVFRDSSAPVGKKITTDGRIVALEEGEGLEKKGFRPGMPPLRNMKMQWTMNDYVALDEQFVYRFKAPDKAFCTMATLNTGAIADFQNYMMHFDYQKMRVGYLYGRFGDNNSVKVECIYEPPQETTDVSFTLLEDPKADRVQALAGLLGLQKVGWIFAHPPREEKFFLSGAEVIAAAEQQLEAAGGIEDTPFVTVTVTIAADDHSKRVVHAFQVTKQGMEMAAEGALLTSANLGHCAIEKTFTAVVEQRETNEVDCNFFLSNVPIQSFDSESFLETFPRTNREGVIQTREDLKKQISKAGREGWRLQDLLADFHLLLFLCDFLDLNHDIPSICRCVVDRETSIDEGHQLIIRSIAGFDM